MSRRGEFEWIARLTEVLGPAALNARGRPAIGDDVAVVTADGVPWTWTVDAQVEGVHFRFDWLDPEDVGHRALAASLSDLAAAGSEPVGALVTAAGPADVFAARLEGIYAGIAGLARRYGCPILGGDLARAEGPLHLTVGALGRVEEGEPWSRSGARPGDEVWVSGELGGPAAAVALLEAEGPAGEALRGHPAWTRLARPLPRIEEARWLRRRAEIRAAIDLSDGLSGDARHIAERSGVRLVVDPGRVPVHPGAARVASRTGRSPDEWTLHGGEEPELLLCVPAGELDPLADAFEERWEVPLTRIGAVEEGEGVGARTDHGVEPLPARSWDHFASR